MLLPFQAWAPVTSAYGTPLLGPTREKRMRPSLPSKELGLLDPFEAGQMCQTSQKSRIPQGKNDPATQEHAWQPRELTERSNTLRLTGRERRGLSQRAVRIAHEARVALHCKAKGPGLEHAARCRGVLIIALGRPTRINRVKTSVRAFHYIDHESFSPAILNLDSLMQQPTPRID